MRILYTTFLLFFITSIASAQTVTVSGRCINSPVVLSPIANINGRAAYQGLGSVSGFPGTPITIYWIGAPDNVWVLDFDGQPFFLNPCNTALPPKTNNGNVSCTWAAVGGTDCPGAAALNIDGTGVLPVKLVSFTATVENEKTLLNWKTSSEVNNKGFEIQRSRDGISWLNIGFVAGRGEAAKDYNYTYMDQSPVIGTTNYRLNQVDIDGKGTLSGIVSVDINNVKDYTLSNNPNRTGLYNFTVRTAEPLEISILDFNGKKLIGKKALQGLQQLDISKYPAGVYLLQIRKSNKIITEKLIKN